ncbi:MAG: 2Fe-2S iron-sulfur cluster-binding protein [Treponema sp.]|nr:2Fe-2S iron-sulfur cluster-binding protein [Treponema sp.]
MAEYFTIDGISVEFEKDLNVLEHAKRCNIDIPACCYTPELSIYGACRMCLVEIVDQRSGRITLDSSCSLLPKPEMVIRTNTKQLRMYRKNILELLIANHCQDCNTCDSNLDCKLQTYANIYNVKGIRYPQLSPKPKLDTSSPCIRKDIAKCILCGLCVRMCNEVQNVGAIDFAHRGIEMRIATVNEKPIGQSNCVGCGQCASICPVGALSIKSDVKNVSELLADQNKKLSVQIAPAVRFAVGNAFGIAPEENTFGRLVAALRLIGFDEVYDTNTAADMTVVQEAEELLERLKTKPAWPLFTSCCPAWIRYVENQFPEVMPHVSTTKSPMQIYAATYKKAGDVNHIHGAIMPCTAKKLEGLRHEFHKNTSFVLTTQEIIQMIKELGIDYASIPCEEVDNKWGQSTSAALIFGVSGGVMEAALRYTLSVLGQSNEENYRVITESGIRGLPKTDAKAGALIDGIKTAKLNLAGTELSVAVVSGLANAAEIIGRIKEGEHFDFVEVMACPGGCICGGGQPGADWALKEKRAEGIYLAADAMPLKSSEQNPIIKEWRTLMGDKKTEHEHWHIHYGGK